MKILYNYECLGSLIHVREYNALGRVVELRVDRNFRAVYFYSEQVRQSGAFCLACLGRISIFVKACLEYKRILSFEGIRRRFISKATLLSRSIRIHKWLGRLIKEFKSKIRYS